MFAAIWVAVSLLLATVFVPAAFYALGWAWKWFRTTRRQGLNDRMIRRSTRNRVSLVLLGALLFAQAALAMAACDWFRAAPAMALAASQGEPTCHEAPVRNANLCLAHCLSFDQSPDSPQVHVPAMPEAPALIVEMMRESAPGISATRFRLPHPAPPPRILFQSFLV